jgi:hypothetical protein
MDRSLLAAVCCAVVLAGCATQPAVQASCLPLAPYSAEFQAALADQLAAAGFGDGDPIVIALRDYGAMRAADRACLAAGK